MAARRGPGGWAAVLLLLAVPAAGGEPVLRWQPLDEPGCGGWITSVAVSPHDPRRVLVGGDILGAGLSEDGGESWQAALGFASWEIADFTWHPTDARTVWVGTMSGPYVSTDGGRTWEARRDGFPPVGEHHYSAPVQKVLFDPADPGRLLAFGGSHRRMTSPGRPMWGAVWESRDAGRSWRRLATIPAVGGDGRNVVAAAFAPGPSPVLYAAADGYGVLASTDGGRTWTVRNSGLPFEVHVNDLAVHPSDPRTLWVALGSHRHPEEHEFTPGGIYKTTDGGATWRSAGRGLAAKAARDADFTSRYQAIAVSPTAPDVLLTSDTAWDGALLYRSDDGGESWRRLAARRDVDCAYPAGLGMTVLEFAPRDADVAFAAGSEYMLRTRDGGRMWVDVTARRAGGPDAWRGRGYSGLCAVQFRFHPRDPGRAVLLAMDHGNFWQSRDGLRSWVWGGLGLPNWGGASDVAFAGADTMYMTLGQHGSFAGIGRTDDGGRTWTVLESFARGLPNLAARAQPVGVHALPEEPDVVWAAVGGELCHSVDGGRRWRVVHAGPGLKWIAPVPGRPRSFYVSGDAGVYRTDDGRTLALVPGSPKKAERLAVEAAPPHRLYATSWRTPHGGLYRFDGAAWRRLRDDPYVFSVAVDPADPRRLAVATNDHPYHDVCRASGVWISADGGETWSRENAGLACLRGEVVAISPHDPPEIVFGTLGRGFYVARWPRP